MNWRALVGILVIPAIVVGLGLVARGDQILNVVLGPINDPSFFCGAPDPTPVGNIGATVVLQECSAGKTVTINPGERIAVDLQNYYGIDTSSDWHDFSISDESVIETIVPPSSRGVRPRSDEIAVYRARQAGESSISAVLIPCTANFGGHCGRGHLWSVTVKVT